MEGSSGDGRLTCWISRTMLAMRPAPSMASSIKVGSSDWASRNATGSWRAVSCRFAMT